MLNTDQPSKLTVVLSFLLTPVLLLILGLVALLRQIQLMQMKRWYKKTLGRKMSSMEVYMYKMYR